MKKSKAKIISTIILFTICVLTFLIIIEVFTAKAKGEQPRILGHTLHVVVTDSMEPHIKPGDFIAAVKVDKADIKVGDYIIFDSPDPALRGKTIVHMVTEITTEGGEIQFKTSGIKEGALPDEYPVKEIIGRYSFKSAFLGRIFILITKIENLLFLGLIIYLLFVSVKQIKRIIKIKKELKTNKQ